MGPVGRVADGELRAQLGDRTGVSRVTVGSIERGDHPASVLALWRLTDALGVPITELLAAAEEPST